MSFLRGIINHSVFKNASALGFMQIANYLVPLLLLPFLTRNLGMEAFGMVSITFAVSQFAFVLTDYGFSLSATYGISLNRENKEYINKKISSIFFVKLILCLIAFSIIISIPYVVNSYSDYKKYFGIVLIAVFAQAFQPIWLFQGIEKMRNITIYNVLTKVVYAILILTFISSDLDTAKVILFWGLSQLIGTIIAFYFIFKEGYKLVLPEVKDIFTEIKDGAQFFWSRLAVSIYTSLSIVVVGVSGPIQAALYSVSEQIYKAGQNVTSPLNTAMYPYMAKNKDWRLFYRMFLISLTILTFGCVFVAIFSVDILSIAFGDEYTEASGVLLVFIAAVIVNYITVTFGYSALGAIGRIDLANKSVMIGALTHLFILLLLYSYGVTALAVAIAVLFTEFLVGVVRVCLFYKFKNNNNNHQKADKTF